MRVSTSLAMLAVLTAGAKPLPPLEVPSELVAASARPEWRAIPAEDLLLIDLEGGARVVIQLAPAFAPVHVANIRALARSNYWQGAAVYRVQDNFVAQWGIGEAQKTLPAGVVAKPPAEYHRSLHNLPVRAMTGRDSYSLRIGHSDGWPIAYDPKADRANLIHCYATVGVARDIAPDTGSGGELYAVIGHAPRHLDRNIAAVGRVIEGIEHLSSMARGTEPLGIYKDGTVARRITAVRTGDTLPMHTRPQFEYLTETSASFALYLQVRANRNDEFYGSPAGGVDICNAPVPVRRSPAT